MARRRSSASAYAPMVVCWQALGIERLWVLRGREHSLRHQRAAAIRQQVRWLLAGTMVPVGAVLTKARVPKPDHLGTEQRRHFWDQSLLRRAKLAFKPAANLVGLEGIKPVALLASERTRPSVAGS
jgi:hypothetical protein